jgi:hypothetical protein
MTIAKDLVLCKLASAEPGERWYRMSTRMRVLSRVAIR